MSKQLNPKVNKNRKKKISEIKEIEQKIEKAKVIVFVDYRGLNVADTTALRVAMRKEKIDYKVYKNNLIKIAFENCKIEVPESAFAGTTAVAFGYDDEVAPARIIQGVIAKTKKLQFKSGVLGGNYVDTEYVKSLANIPSKDVLIAKLAYLLKAPIQKLAIALSEVAKKQGA